jgi:flagellar biosynthesis protein FlhB
VSAEKPFDATPTRRERARREGNVARSHEAGAVAAFGAAALTVVMVLPALGAAAANLTRIAARQHAAQLPATFAALLALACTPMVAAAAAATALHLAQGGGLRVSGLKLDLARLSPKVNLGRMFGGEAVVSALRSVLVLGVVSAALIPLGVELLTRAALVRGPLGAALSAWSAIERAGAAALVTGALFAGAEYALARRRWLRGLKMNLEELKRDRKENDGDPRTRSRRSSMHRALVRGAIARTREASFVVVNPTHVAVAIRYAPPAVPVPQILVRAADEAALRVRAIARRAGIPVIENIALARALFASGDSGSPIPRETYVAVAHVIAELTRAGLLS